MNEARGSGLPEPRVYLWVLPEAIAFSHSGGKKSLLSLIRATAAIARSVAEERAGRLGKKRLTRSFLLEVTAELFVRAADRIPSTTVAQKHQPDVILQLNGADIDILFSKLLAPVELERAALFMLHMAFTSARTAGVINSAVEFQTWLDDLAHQSRSVSLPASGGGE